MNPHKQFTWLLISSLAIVAVLGLALSSPTSAIGQARSTPTRVPPGPRTLPPGIRLTPTPVPVQATQPAQGNPENTTTPTPVILLPKSGGSMGGGDEGLGLVAVAGLGLFALGLILTRRRSRTE